MAQLFRTCAITDEFGDSLEHATAAMAALGMSGAEIRMVNGKNVTQLTNGELRDVRRVLDSYELKAVSVASPVGKYNLNSRWKLGVSHQIDAFGASQEKEGPMKLLDQAFNAADILGADLIRIFGYLRLSNRARHSREIIDALGCLADQANRAPFSLVIENEHVTNFCSGEEMRDLNPLFDDYPKLGIVWDPANAVFGGSGDSLADLYRLPDGRIQHVHVKDCRLVGGKMEWCKLGNGQVDWPKQISALARFGYRGYLSLETHWRGGDFRDSGASKHFASVACACVLRSLVEIEDISKEPEDG